MTLNDEVTSSPDIIYVGTFRLLARPMFLEHVLNAHFDARLVSALTVPPK